MAGVAASVTNNGIGLSGVCWNCKIMALRAIGVDGTGTTDTIAKAIDYAITNGADIINMSFVGNQTDEILSTVVRADNVVSSSTNFSIFTFSIVPSNYRRYLVILFPPFWLFDAVSQSRHLSYSRFLRSQF